MGGRGHPALERTSPTMPRSRIISAPAATYTRTMATVARPPDAELLRRLRARDRTAWEELYAEYQPRLRAFALPAGREPARRRRSRAGDVPPRRAAPRPARPGDDATSRAYLFATLQEPLPEAGREARSARSRWRRCPSRRAGATSRTTPSASLLLRGQQDEVRLANASCSHGSGSCWRSASSRTARTRRSASSSA